MVRSTPKYLKWRHNQNHGRTRMPPLQAVDRTGRGARLLEHDRSGSDTRPARESAGRVGAAARNSGRVRPAADLRLRSRDHVRAKDVLLLRPAEEAVPRGLRVPRQTDRGDPGATRRAAFEIEI